MHPRGARKGNQDAAIFCRNRTPCTGRWLSRATSPVPRYLRRKGDSICPLRSKRDQTATRDYGSHREHRPRPPGPARVPLQPETRPAWGLRSPARRTTSLPAPPLRPANALPAARGKQNGVFDCVHSATPTWPRPPAGLTFAEQRQQKQPPQPRRRLRHRPCAPGSRQEDGGSDTGCRQRGVVLSRAAPSRPGRAGRGGHCGRGASERDTGALSAAWAGL